MLMDGWTDGRMKVVLGSKAQHQALVAQGRGISTVSGAGCWPHSWGSLLDGQGELFYLVATWKGFQTEPTALYTQVYTQHFDPCTYDDPP